MNTLSNAIGSFGAMANHGKRICFCRHRESRNIWEYSKDPYALCDSWNKSNCKVREFHNGSL